ncbi:unnamed protein product [Protopolystoma xenopodis]|uniref:IPT/TIG domain-containing protein n=1 Tax=Protopolystoma xenopodis TaxID=117903 RepID=A0A3S4ZX40_9PLAT|nr:unnamed protein product [Protopolystoma xenopodis]
MDLKQALSRENINDMESLMNKDALLQAKINPPNATTRGGTLLRLYGRNLGQTIGDIIECYFEGESTWPESNQSVREIYGQNIEGNQGQRKVEGRKEEDQIESLTGRNAVNDWESIGPNQGQTNKQNGPEETGSHKVTGYSSYFGVPHQLVHRPEKPLRVRLNCSLEMAFFLPFKGFHCRLAFRHFINEVDWPVLGRFHLVLGGRPHRVSSAPFSLLPQRFDSVFPHVGPRAGGTLLSLMGKNLNAGNQAEVFIVLAYWSHSLHTSDQQLTLKAALHMEGDQEAKWTGNEVKPRISATFIPCYLVRSTGMPV